MLRDRLVTEHLPVAQHIARRFGHRGEPHEDLVQVATVGLINAVDRFDPDRGSDFLSFAVPTIMGEVRKYFRDSSWSVRMPRRLKELHLAINAGSVKAVPVARTRADPVGARRAPRASPARRSTRDWRPETLTRARPWTTC